VALGSTQTLTEMSTRYLPGGKEWPALKANNLIAICELIVYNSGSQPLSDFGFLDRTSCIERFNFLTSQMDHSVYVECSLSL
jgi:hypothetical protein